LIFLYRKLETFELYRFCRIVFKGCGEEEAVLCTSEKTYLVREVETTNLVMLVKDPTDPQTSEESHKPADIINDIPVNCVEGSTEQNLLERGSDQNLVLVTALVKSHLELSQIKPKLEKLDQILKMKHIIKDIHNIEHGGQELPEGETWNGIVGSV